MSHIPTASQTVGPFFTFGLTTNRKLGVVAGPDCDGERIRLTIPVIDGDGAVCCGDVMIGYRFDIVLRGRQCTPFEDPRR